MRLSPASWLPSAARWFPSAVLCMFLMGVAILTTQSAYTPGDLVVLGLLYATFAVALSCAARLLARHGPQLEIAGALVIGAVAAWHLREQLRPAGVGPTLWTVAGMTPFLVSVVAAAGVQFVLGRLVTKPGPESRLGRYLLASSVVFGSVLFLSYTGSETLRWHLLRHNTLLGTPAFHLLSPNVDELEEDAWARHGRGAISQPDWVHSTHHEDHQTDANTIPGAGDVSGNRPEPGRQPDVVFVLLDTLRADVLADYGGDSSLMPTLNALAERSVVFADVLANTSWTRPSVASFFTGLAPEEHGAVGWSYPMSRDVVTLAEVFKRRGYETAAFVANHEAVNSKGGFDRGFDHFEPLEDRGRRYARADFATDRVSEWLGDRVGAREQPLFLYVHYLDPHIPYMSSGNDADSTGSNEDTWGFYEDEVRFLDTELDRLFRSLDQSLSPSRVTLVTSDHGEEFGEHDAKGHAQTLYSEVLHIPAILSIDAPSRRSPQAVASDPLEGRDFFELLLRIAETPDRAVLPLVRSLGRETRVASLSFSKGSGLFHDLLRPYRTRIFSRMVQRDGWRLIRSAYGPTRELYNLRDDPAETNNRVGQWPDLVESLTAKLDAMPPSWRRAGEIGISEESLERLRGLGYIR